MVRQELIGGLRNAIERGCSLEEAKRSFISAGYSSAEVEEASQYLHEGSLNMQEAPMTQEPEVPEQIEAPKVHKSFFGKPKPKPQPEPEAQFHELVEEKEKKPRDFKVIILIVVLAILIGVLTATIIFREKILALFSG